VAGSSASSSDLLAEIVRLLHGIGTMVMGIDAKLEKVVNYLGGDDEEEEADS
jgi:hypothetical protein